MCDVFNVTNYCAITNSNTSLAALQQSCAAASVLTSSAPDCVACSFQNDTQRQAFLLAYSDKAGGNVGLVCASPTSTNAAAPRGLRSQRHGSPFSSPLAKLVAAFLAALAAMSLLGSAAASPLAEARPRRTLAGGSKSWASRRTEALSRRANADVKCSGFRVESQEASHMPSASLSGIAVCYGSAAPCPVSPGSPTSRSIDAALVLTGGGGGVSGIDVPKVFGADYASSTTVSFVGGFRVPANQAGRVTATARSTLFRGNFTGCRGDGGADERAGEANVPRVNQQVASLVLTDA